MEIIGLILLYNYTFERKDKENTGKILALILFILCIYIFQIIYNIASEGIISKYILLK